MKRLHLLFLLLLCAATLAFGIAGATAATAPSTFPACRMFGCGGGPDHCMTAVMMFGSTVIVLICYTQATT